MPKKIKKGYVESVLADEDKFFLSHDLGLVAFLLCDGFELAGLDKSVRSKVLFSIKRGKGIDQSITDYWNFSASVDPQSFFNQMKRLKNQIFSSN